MTAGRLLQTMVCVLRRLDTAATGAVADGGFDDEFNEVLPVDDGTQLGATSKREMAPIKIECQLARKTWGRDEVSRGGHEDNTDIVLTMLIEDLEDLGLFADGKAKIYSGDRIEQIEDLDGNVQWVFPNPPGMFVYQVTAAGPGLDAMGTPEINLLDIYCSTTEQGGK